VPDHIRRDPFALPRTAAAARPFKVCLRTSLAHLGGQKATTKISCAIDARASALRRGLPFTHFGSGQLRVEQPVRQRGAAAEGGGDAEQFV